MMKLDDNKQRTNDGAPASRRPLVVDEAVAAKSSAKSVQRRSSKVRTKDNDDINAGTQKAVEAVEEKMDAWTFIRTVHRPDNLSIQNNAEPLTAHEAVSTAQLTPAARTNSAAEATTKKESSPSASTTALDKVSGGAGFSRAAATTKSGKRRSVMAWIGAKANGARTPASTPTEEAAVVAAPSSAALMAAAASTIATSCAAAKAPSSLKLKAFQNARQITFHSLDQFDGSGGGGAAATATPAPPAQLRQHSAHATTACSSSEPVFSEFDSPAASDALDARRRQNHPSSGGGSASGDHVSGVPSSTTAISASSSLSSLRSLKNCFVKNRSSIYSTATTAEAVDDIENNETKASTTVSQESNAPVNSSTASGPLNKSASNDDATTPFMS